MSLMAGGLGSLLRGYYWNVQEHGEDATVRPKTVVNKSYLDFLHMEEHGEDTTVMGETP